MSVNASLGGIVEDKVYPVYALASVGMKIGDYKLNSDMQPGQLSSASLSSEVNYDNIRRELWKVSDMMYKYSLNSFAYKQNFLQNNSNRRYAFVQ